MRGERVGGFGGSSRVTSADVARASGVSRSTVSYVLNDTPGQTIPEATRRKVLAAAKQLGYTPHGPAQALSRGRGSIVLLCLPDFPPNPVMGHLVEALAGALGAHELMLVTHTERARPAARAGTGRRHRPHRRRRSGAVHRGSGRCVRRARCQGGVPGTGDAPPRGDAGHSVGAVQVEHLAARGHDDVAFAVLHAAREAGLRVPDELAVMGADDIAQARYACPPLTTIRSAGGPSGRMLAWLVRQRLGIHPPSQLPGKRGALVRVRRQLGPGAAPEDPGGRLPEPDVRAGRLLHRCRQRRSPRRRGPPSPSSPPRSNRRSRQSCSSTTRSAASPPTNR
ncbi:LacI family DNA-binding transcriptional regulator [Streptodolium elevatio]